MLGFAGDGRREDGGLDKERDGGARPVVGRAR